MTTVSPPRIDPDLVRRLVAAQFPQWAGLAIRAADPQGWDNRTFRLGDALAARLPSAAPYAAQIEKEQAWLPKLAPGLPLPIPAPVAMGEPGEDYPWRWSVNRWLEGETAAAGAIEDLGRLAADLAGFLAALQATPADGPPAGAHSFGRGGPLAAYDPETRRAVQALGGRIDGAAALEVWEAALAASWRGRAAWFHGDVAAGNLLIRDGRLAAVLDFGCSGVGDPACDLVIAWTLFAGESRAAFRAALPLPADAWIRGRGWALWKALIVLAGRSGADPAGAGQQLRIIEAVIADHRSEERDVR